MDTDTGDNIARSIIITNNQSVSKRDELDTYTVAKFNGTEERGLMDELSLQDELQA